MQLALIERFGLEEPLASVRASGRPRPRDLRGLILAARAWRPEQRSFGWLDVDVARNAYGRQLDSFGPSRTTAAAARLHPRAAHLSPRTDGRGATPAIAASPCSVRAGNLTCAGPSIPS